MSNVAYMVMKDTSQQKSFIGERGFNKLISKFREVIEKRGWNFFYKHKPAGFAALVQEFYANMVGKKENTVYVKAKWISFDRGAINKTYNLKELKDGSKFKKLQKEPDFQMIVELLTHGKGEWSSTKNNPYESIERGLLIEEAKVWFYFIRSILLPSKHMSIVRQEEVVLLYALLKGYKMNVGKIIENSIMNYYRSKYRGLMPYSATITRLCILGGVKGTWEEKEMCPKTSPLTLTGNNKSTIEQGQEKVARGC